MFGRKKNPHNLYVGLAVLHQRCLEHLDARGEEWAGQFIKADEGGGDGQPVIELMVSVALQFTAVGAEPAEVEKAAHAYFEKELGPFSVVDVLTVDVTDEESPWREGVPADAAPGWVSEVGVPVMVGRTPEERRDAMRLLLQLWSTGQMTQSLWYVEAEARPRANSDTGAKYGGAIASGWVRTEDGEAALWAVRRRAWHDGWTLGDVRDSSPVEYGFQPQDTANETARQCEKALQQGVAVLYAAWPLDQQRIAG